MVALPKVGDGCFDLPSVCCQELSRRVSKCGFEDFVSTGEPDIARGRGHGFLERLRHFSRVALQATVRFSTHLVCYLRYDQDSGHDRQHPGDRHDQGGARSEWCEKPSPNDGPPLSDIRCVVVQAVVSPGQGEWARDAVDSPIQVAHDRRLRSFRDQTLGAAL